MLAKVYGSALYGIDAFPITIEVSVTNGLGYRITGLPDEAVSESLSRIEVAIKSNGYHMPRTKVIINLAPAGVRKTGTALDLPIALGILLASEQLHDLGKLQDYVLVGELGLDGAVYPVRGALCVAHRARQDGYRGILLPPANTAEAALVEGIDVYAIRHIKEAVAFITADGSLSPVKRVFPVLRSGVTAGDFADVRGQPGIKRALEIAAAGGHNTLLVGPPGVGKTMLASRLPSILPAMSLEESMETTRIYSVVPTTGPLSGLIRERPFRSPHHTASEIGLAGGGNFPMPGEISLAHNGVLFLDELPEFRRGAIEILRQPMEEGRVRIARARGFVEFPARFMLLAAMNPCLCGYFGHPGRSCTCSKRALYWYRRRISGPLLERIDLQVRADPVSIHEWDADVPEEKSTTIRGRVEQARAIQAARFAALPNVFNNAQLPHNELDRFCLLEPAARKYLLGKLSQGEWSARTYTRVLKVSRTIADLKSLPEIQLEHVAEAFHFRSLDQPMLNTAKK